MRIAVLGAGVSGITVAKLLHEKGNDVVVYEKEKRPGGLARTRIVEGYIYDPFGGHIFNSKRKEIVDWVFSIMPREQWQYTERNAKIWFDGLGFTSYPFELSLMELPTDIGVDCVLDYVQAQQGTEPEDFRNWLIWNFGEKIANAYMLPYNSKIWAFPLEEMETGWIREKMPVPSKREILMSITSRGYKERKTPHSAFYYPLKGGIQTMVDKISEGLNINLECLVERIENRDNKWFVNSDGPYDSLITTIQPQVLLKVMKLPVEVENAIEGLKYNHLNTVLFNCEKTDITWCYIPEKKYRAHRVGFQSALTPYAAPNGEGCAALEIIGERIKVDDKLLKNGSIIPDSFGAKRVIDTAYAEYAYVIHDLKYRKNVDVLRKYFKEQSGLYALGRWGEWNYNNMDVCMGDAFELVKRSFK